MTDEVTLTFGVDTRNMSLARSVAATMAGRFGLTVDRLEDVRLAVDEAVSQVLDWWQERQPFTPGAQG